MFKRLSLLLLFFSQAIAAIEKNNYIYLEINSYGLQRISNANKSDQLLSERSELPNSSQRKLQNENQSVIDIQNDLSIDFEKYKNLFLSNSREGLCLNTNCSIAQIQIKMQASKTKNNISLKKIRKSNDIIIMFHTLAFITLLAIIFAFNIYYCGSIVYSNYYKKKFKLITKLTK